MGIYNENKPNPKRQNVFKQNGLRYSGTYISLFVDNQAFS